MTEAEGIIAGYAGPLRAEALELAENIVTLRHAIDAARPVVEKEPLYVTTMVGDRYPHPVQAENKAWTSFRSQVRAHHDALLRLNNLMGSAYTLPADYDPLEGLFEELHRIRGGGVPEEVEKQ